MKQGRIVLSLVCSILVSAAVIGLVRAPIVSATFNPAAALQNPVESWSRITYASDRAGNWEIYTTLGDGTNETRLTSRSASDSTPKINRGGTKIAFVSDASGKPEIYTINVNGSGETRLTFTGKGEYLSAWSPDGTKIVFTSLRDGSPSDGNYEIYTMNADGSAQTRLTNNSSWDAHPAWSPDGQQIAFVSNRAGNYQLWLMDANGANPQVVSAALTYALYPAWSPDGSRLAFNDDANGDGTYDVAVINRDGSGLWHPLGYAPANTDYRAPVWSPDGQQIAFAMTHRISSSTWDWAKLYAFDLTTQNLRQMTTANREWWIHWNTTDLTAPTSIITLPVLAASPTFTVTWSGSDAGAGVKYYDLQVRDGSGGSWTPWLTATSQTQAVFSGQLAHTYYFQSRATDFSGNVEAYPGGNGKASTTTPQYQLTGTVLGHRGQAVSAAQLESEPQALGPALSATWGKFVLYYNLTGTHTLTATRYGFGTLPPMQAVKVSETPDQPIFYLPPLTDTVVNGQFESGDMSGWRAIGEMTPTITTTAHTGHYAVQLGGSGNGPGQSTLTQVISRTEPTTGTLSVVYLPGEIEPISTTLRLIVEGAVDTLSTTVPLTGTDWQHIWLDVPPTFSPAFTLTVDLETTNSGPLAPVSIDEVSLGVAVVGEYPAFLPVVAR